MTETLPDESRTETPGEPRPAPALDAPYATSIDWLQDALGSDSAKGLASGTAAQRLAENGPNEIRGEPETPAWKILLHQFSGAVIWLLLAAAALAVWMGEHLDALAIGIVLVVNALIGFATELRARKSMSALRALVRTETTVLRDGRSRRIDAADLVPGDIVLLEAGDLVPADLRVFRAADLQVDESALTGESIPVSKETAALDHGVSVVDQTNMVFRGTSVTRGNGAGIAVATGQKTRIGEIADLVSRHREERTPLEDRLDRLGRQLAIGTLLVTAIIVLIGLAQGRGLLHMIETGIALAVAAVPEGLPIVATLALARGMWRMAARNALINRLATVETLGSTDILLTDKTGTLTENRMHADRFIFPDSELTVAAAAETSANRLLDRALEVSALCNNATTGPDGAEIGDPIEVALLRAVEAAGQDPHAIREACPRRAEIPFDADRKLMATVHEGARGHFAAVKGAPEAVLAACTTLPGPDGATPLDDAGREALAALADAAAAKGLRLLGIAEKPLEGPDDPPTEDLAFIGFVGVVDPPRPEVRAAIEECRSAGVRVIMVTGDHAATARRIAEDVSLVGPDAPPACAADAIPDETSPSDSPQEDVTRCHVFARVPPHKKLRLVELHQANGSVVAMTGDGVNDAPALKKADIGIAMGQRGTQVAAQAADMILRDDAFGSIVSAIRQGRIIYGNIRTLIRYLLSCNISEILTLGIATLSGLALPLLPLQILFLNLVTDVLPALAIGFGEGADDVMRHAPRRRDEPLMGRRQWFRVVLNALLLAAGSLGAFLFTLRSGMTEEARTVAFFTLCYGQLAFVFAMREGNEPIWRSEITRNRYVWLGILASALAAFAAAQVPVLADILSLVPLGTAEWLTVLCGTLAPILASELIWHAGQIAGQITGRRRG